MEKNLIFFIFASDRVPVLKNGFSQFFEIEQEFCLGFFGDVGWDLNLPK